MFQMTFTTKPHKQKLQKNFNILMNSHLQWMIYYPQNWNSCIIHAILLSGMMDPHCQIIVTYWWWSMFCMIVLSSTHLKNISKKQVNYFKIALQQLNSREHTHILLSSMAAPHLSFSFTNPPSYHLQKPRSLRIMHWKNTDDVFCILY